tara:strand:- start:1653 stop:1808 length:156 start_codon:yes stop_codon:yes gene_type:complete
MIGDKEKDITASNGTGVNKAILVKSGLNDDEMSTKAKFALAPINGNIQMVT